MGNSLNLLTLAHVFICLIAMGAGLLVLGGLVAGHIHTLYASILLSTTALACITGFLFPINGFTPALGVSFASLAVLLPTAFAFLARQRAQTWRVVYIFGAATLVYLNVFVLVAQLFLKVPAMRELAPTLREGPFLLVQGAVLGAFVFLARKAHIGFRSPRPQIGR